MNWTKHSIRSTPKVFFRSVTQAFNTAISMRRLTLNVLLSIARFERKVLAERIRDNIAASKKKGHWMGRSLPFGYERHPDLQRRQPSRRYARSLATPCNPPPASWPSRLP